MAEGYGNLTNGDTAILSFPLNYVRAGEYPSGQGDFVLRDTQGTYYSTECWARERAYDLGFRPTYYSPHGNPYGYAKGDAYSVRCENPSPIFSPEAMGWPRESELQTLLRRFS